MSKDNKRYKLLDLFSGAGGCAKGYQRAGFYVVGVDINEQPDNCADEFIQMDALEFLDTQDLSRYSVIHASPPCQRFSRMQSLGIARNGGYNEHPDLIEPTREKLIKTGKTYVIENVVGAPLNNFITLCGTMFGLKVYRHRIFESNRLIFSPSHIPHRDSTPSAGNGISPKGFISVCGTGGIRGMNVKQIMEYWSAAMEIDWMNRAELAQAIPPAYCEFIGRQIIEQLKQTA